MYIPGINYNRPTYGEAQEDITRFGRIAAAEGAGAVAAAELAGKQAASDVQAKGYDLALQHTLESNALTQQGYDMNNKWAAIDQVANLGLAILTDVVAPIYNQKVDNQIAEAQLVYQWDMDANALAIDEHPTRVEEAGDGTLTEVSNGDQLHETWAEGQRIAMEEALKGVTLPEAKEALNRSWGEEAVVMNGKLTTLGASWDRAVVESDWQAHYDMLGSMPSAANYAEQREWLESGFKNKVINAAKYSTGLIEVRANRETFEVNTSLMQIAGTTDPNAQNNLITRLEDRIHDAEQLQTLGPLREADVLDVRAEVAAARLKQSNALRTAQNLEIKESSALIRNRIEAIQGVIASDIGSEYVGNELSAMSIALDIGYEAIETSPVMMFDPVKRETAIKNLNAGAQTRYTGIVDSLLNQEGGPNTEEYSKLHSAVLLASPYDLGFRDPATGADEKEKLLTNIEGVATRHKTIFKQQSKNRVIAEGVEKFKLGTFTIPASGKFDCSTMGIACEVTAKEVMDSMYMQAMAEVDLKQMQGQETPAGGWWSGLDAASVQQYGTDIPGIHKDDIKEGLTYAPVGNPDGTMDISAFEAGAERLRQLRTLQSDDGHSSGQVLATSIVGSLSPQHRDAVNYYESLNRDGQPLTQLQQENLKAVVAYGSTSVAMRADDAKNIKAALATDEAKIDLIEKVMEREDWPDGMIEAAVVNPHLLVRFEQALDKTAGNMHPLIAGERAVAEVLSEFGMTERKGIEQSGGGLLETKLNAGRPMPGLKEDHSNWKNAAGVYKHFDDPSDPLIEKVYQRLDADGKLMFNPDGDPMYEVTYLTSTGLPVMNKDGKVATYHPDPYNFPDTVRNRKKKQTEANKAMYKKGQAAMDAVYERFPNMEDDFWNPNNEWGFIGTPFVQLPAVPSGEFVMQRQKEAAAGKNQGLPDWPSWTKPSTWWSTFDPEQEKATELSPKLQQYIRVQLESKFELLLEEEGHDIGSDGYAQIAGLKAMAYEAALFNASHNDKAFPSYSEQEFIQVYPFANERFQVNIEGQAARIPLGGKASPAPWPVLGR